jgi:aconitate hydratase
MQDFTGVPAIVDLAAMRGSLRKMAATRQGEPACAGRARDRPLVQVDVYGTPEAYVTNASLEKRNAALRLLRWGRRRSATSSCRPTPASCKGEP